MSATSDKYAATEDTILDAIKAIAEQGSDAGSGATQNEARANLVAALAGALEIVQKRTGPNLWAD